MDVRLPPIFFGIFLTSSPSSSLNLISLRVSRVELCVAGGLIFQFFCPHTSPPGCRAYLTRLLDDHGLPGGRQWYTYLPQPVLGWTIATHPYPYPYPCVGYFSKPTLYYEIPTRDTYDELPATTQYYPLATRAQQPRPTSYDQHCHLPSRLDLEYFSIQDITEMAGVGVHTSNVLVRIDRTASLEGGDLLNLGASSDAYDLLIGVRTLRSESRE